MVDYKIMNAGRLVGEGRGSLVRRVRLGGYLGSITDRWDVSKMFLEFQSLTFECGIGMCLVFSV